MLLPYCLLITHSLIVFLNERSLKILNAVYKSSVWKHGKGYHDQQEDPHTNKTPKVHKISVLKVC